MTQINEQTDMTKISMAEVVLAFPQALEIVKKYDLDFCCGGKKAFSEACKKSGVDAEKVWKDIMQAKSNHAHDNGMNFNAWDIPLIIDFILQHHHQYVRSSIPQIKALLEKVCSAHGDDNPNLYSVKEDFDDLANELLTHMPKEENVLFPAMKRIFIAQNPKGNSEVAQEHLEMPISVMEHEHERAGELIKSIRSLADNYTPPSYACPTYQMAYIMLSQFDNDLMQHIHIENNILFPKALKAFVEADENDRKAQSVCAIR